MERMDTQKKLDRLEINYDYLKEENEKLKKENKKLKSDLAYERTMLDNVKAEYKSLQNVIKKLKKRVIELEKEREFLLEANSVSAE